MRHENDHPAESCAATGTVFCDSLVGLMLALDHPASVARIQTQRRLTDNLGLGASKQKERGVT